MAKLAIQGHISRGNEVIEILEMLGGKKNFVVNGNTSSIYRYYIDSCNEINVFTAGNEDLKHEYITFTLEEFLEKFPYKVGDVVEYSYAIGRAIATIKTIYWVNDSIVYTMDNGDNRLSQDLKLYKQKTMEEQIKIDIPEGYKFSGVDNQQVVFEKVKPKYPKDFEECCYILEANVDAYFDHEDPYSNDYEFGLEKKLLCLRKLLICRGAYWKLAGEEMGLGKPWEPDYIDESYEQRSPTKYVIYYTGTYIAKGVRCTSHNILAFPTEKMRDEFYENFKNIIENCKELL